VRVNNRGFLTAAIIAGALVPLGMIVWDFQHDGLGANPIEEITHRTGEWALRFLVVTLAITPLRRLTGRNGLISHRRTFGLLAFLYATLHLSTFVVLDHYFDWQRIVADVGKRRFVTAGFAAFLCMVPLAITSTRGWIRRLGKSWTRLHRLVYAAAILAVVHFYWLVKSNVKEPLTYAAIVALLLASRMRRAGGTWRLGTAG
jgi:sulfoxide reductase heme-binding subunit YedZ